MPSARERSIKKGSIIYYESDIEGKIFVLVKGEARTVQFSEKKDSELAWHRGVCIMGESRHISDDFSPFPIPDPYTYGMFAAKECEVIECGKERFLHLAASSYEVSAFMLDDLSRKIRFLQERAYGYQGSFKQRVARHIDKYFIDGDKISIKCFAIYFACKYETISRIVADLHKCGAIVKTGNRLAKINREILREIYFE